MKAKCFLLLAGALFICSPSLFASSPSQKALWIEVIQKGNHKTIVAVTEEIARELLDSSNPKCQIAMDEGHGQITRAMLKAVLNGEQETLEVQDEHGGVLKLYMADLDAPSHKGGTGKLVLETFKSGSRTLRMVLPEVEIEANDEEDGDSIEMHLGWKGLLPFLARAGGAIYVNSGEDDTEVWVYLE
jgi:hypothetical protein